LYLLRDFLDNMQAKAVLTSMANEPV